MCNLYSITTNQVAISALFRVVNRYVGNLAPMPRVFPDYKAPIVRNGAEGRELATARWGMPSSSKALMDATKRQAEKLQAKSKPVDFKELLRMEPDGGTTNIRNVTSKHWTKWLGVENRCVVPFNSFSEFNKAAGLLKSNRPCCSRSTAGLNAMVVIERDGRSETLALSLLSENPLNFESASAPSEPHAFDGRLILSADGKKDIREFHMTEPTGHGH